MDFIFFFFCVCFFLEVAVQLSSMFLLLNFFFYCTKRDLIDFFYLEGCEFFFFNPLVARGLKPLVRRH
jgi:hypothetical protein